MTRVSVPWSAALHNYTHCTALISFASRALRTVPFVLSFFRSFCALSFLFVSPLWYVRNFDALWCVRPGG